MWVGRLLEEGARVTAVGSLRERFEGRWSPFVEAR